MIPRCALVRPLGCLPDWLLEAVFLVIGGGHWLQSWRLCLISAIFLGRSYRRSLVCLLFGFSDWSAPARKLILADADWCSSRVAWPMRFQVGIQCAACRWGGACVIAEICDATVWED